MNKTVVLDVDGVLADFEGAVTEKFGDKDRHIVKLDQRFPDKAVEIADFVFNPLTYKDLGVLPFGKHIALWLEKAGYRIDVVSSRPPLAKGITKNWLIRNGIPFDSLWVDNSEDKTSVIGKIRPLFAVDDIGVIAERLAKLGIPCILIAQPYNITYIRKYPRISKFSHFLYRYKQLSGENL